jgi:hypothetical protein
LEHPIREKYKLAQRKKLSALLKQKYDLVRQDSIIFVCGGNNARDARTRFLEIAPKQLPDYDFFKPEYAISSQSLSADVPFNLARFEELVADISEVVVVFPEAPRSYCETGYFSAKSDISKKILLVINEDYQGDDSFISMGPVHVINESSHFRPTQYVNYLGNFDSVIRRIEKRKPPSQRKVIKVVRYNELSQIEKIGMVQKIIDILQMATIEDILYIFRSAFDAKIKEREVRELIAILVGSNYVLNTGPYGHLYLNALKRHFLGIRDGSKTDETEIRFEVAELIESDLTFNQILLAAKNAG